MSASTTPPFAPSFEKYHCCGDSKGSFVTSLIDVSPQECPFDDTVSVYKAVARNLELPPEDPNAIPERGIDAVLVQLVRDRIKANGKALHSVDGNSKSNVHLSWLEHFLNLDGRL